MFISTRWVNYIKTIRRYTMQYPQWQCTAEFIHRKIPSRLDEKNEKKKKKVPGHCPTYRNWRGGEKEWIKRIFLKYSGVNSDGSSFFFILFYFEWIYLQWEYTVFIIRKSNEVFMLGGWVCMTISIRSKSH